MGRDKQKQKVYQKVYQKKYYQRNKQKILEYKNPDPEKRKKYRNYCDKKYRSSRYESVIQSLYAGVILNMALWCSWFNNKHHSRKTAYDLSAEDAFILMLKRCYYCGDFATTLDRLDSTKDHTSENCVGCCEFCNKSKGAMDPMSFILRAVYRRTYEYYEDTDIWYDNRTKPRFDNYTQRAERQNRMFNLTREQFNKFITSQCHYCKRVPARDKYFGIDKIFPDDGYTMDNCVSCCQSCNRAKWDASSDEFTLRDECITQRYLHGYFDNLPYVKKNMSNFKNA